jgi:hypothetical protein
MRFLVALAYLLRCRCPYISGLIDSALSLLMSALGEGISMLFVFHCVSVRRLGPRSQASCPAACEGYLKLRTVVGIDQILDRESAHYGGMVINRRQAEAVLCPTRGAKPGERCQIQPPTA